MSVQVPGFQPKQLYRELERLLREGEQKGLGADWFRWVVDEIVGRLGEPLLIENGRLYDEADEGGFELVHEVASRDPQALGVLIRRDYRPLQLLMRHGVFIFDRTVAGQSPNLEGRLGGMESAGVVIDSQPKRIMAFGLLPGWERDDLDFTLNTLRNAIEHRLDVQHLKTDYVQAAEIQRSLLPEKSPRFPGYSIAARSLTAEIVGGDFFDYLQGDPGTMVFALGDASGHGLPAALLARDVITGLRMGTERALKITAIMNRLNRVIARSAFSTRFASLFFGELEANGNLFYVNAGHPPPLVTGLRGTRTLTTGGTILGPVNNTKFQRGWAHVDRGDTLAVVSDGLLERENAAEEMFGEKNLERILRSTMGRPAEQILDTLLESAKEFGDGKPWADDTTVMVVVRRP